MITINAAHTGSLTSPTFAEQAAGYGTYASVNMILAISAFSVILANENYGRPNMSSSGTHKYIRK
jgi:hypothetical protein